MAQSNDPQVNTSDARINRNGLERRRSRASFQKTLEKICTRLSESPTATGCWQDRLLGEINATVEGISLWVVGSFARGASNCGDLDLVFCYRVKQGRNVGGRRAAQVLFRNLPDVRVYGGTPANNESGASFPEAVLVWQGRKFDWRNAIAGIEENPLVGRFSRSTDRIPFRVEQFAAEVDVEYLEEITAMEANGVINWTFTPISDVEIAKPLSNDELTLERLQKQCCGQKTLRLLPYLLGYFRKFGGSPTPGLRSNFDRSEFGLGGTKVLLGRPSPGIGLLNEITVAQLLLLPHLSARGPNGFWAIRRGPNHPLVRDAAHISAYYLVDENGEPDILHVLSNDGWVGASAHCLAKGLDLFSTKREAIDFATEINEMEHRNVQVVEAKGCVLLDLLANLDMIYYCADEIALTDTGCRATNMKSPISGQEIIKLLGGFNE